LLLPQFTTKKVLRLKELRLDGGIEKLLASLGSASTQKCFAFLVAPAEQFAMSYSVRIATFPEGGNSLVAVPPLRYNGSQEGAA